MLGGEDLQELRPLPVEGSGPFTEAPRNHCGSQERLSMPDASGVIVGLLTALVGRVCLRVCVFSLSK